MKPDRPQENLNQWICPDLQTYWKLNKKQDSDQFILQAIEGDEQFSFSQEEAFALRYFNGCFPVEQVQKFCNYKLGKNTPNLVSELLQKLITLNILVVVDLEAKPSIPPFKACVQWIEHPGHHWILRNPEDVTYLQVGDRTKVVIEDLAQFPADVVAQKHDISLDEMRSLYQMLAAAAMFEGSKLPKPPKRKFTPLQLLSFKISLFNPDHFLTQCIDSLRWIWTRYFALFLCFSLTFSLIVGLSQRQEILNRGHQLFTAYGMGLTIPFFLLIMLVVTLHELGHALTLKHYGGIVPDVGFLFMLLIPAAYTNTSDSYCLNRHRRVLVVAAGVICQLIIAAFALGMWNVAVSGSWLETLSYLLLVAALFTVALNLNPLAKFDGYYLAVALTGVNNLRSRCFKFYGNLLKFKPTNEPLKDAVAIATYAPFCFVYILSIFGFLFYRLTDWSLSQIPTLTLILLTLWAIYFYFPTQSKQG